MDPTKQKMGLKDFFKTFSRAFETPPIPANSAGPGFTRRTETLPNGGGTYSTPVPNSPNMSMIPPTPPAPTPAPAGPATPPPSGGAPAPIFKGSATPPPTTPTAPANLDYSRYTNPQTGKPYTPQEYSEFVASRFKEGAVPNYAGDAVTKEMTPEQLQKRAMLMNNARNDMATGEKDPLKVASKSKIPYNATELAAIEKAYAGIYDPAINDVFIKLDRVQKIEEAEKKAEAELKKMEQQHKYDLELKKTPSGDAQLELQEAKEAATGGSGDFANTIDLVSNMESSVYGKKTVAKQLRNMIDTKDYASAYALIANTLGNGLTGENKTKFANARRDLLALDGMQKSIQKYAEAGGDMGLLKGTEEEILRKLGQSSGPASALATELTRSFQRYRGDLSGAAFGAGESRDYDSVNPSLGKSLDLNLQVLEGARNDLGNMIVSQVDSLVPSAKYIREYAEGAVPGQEKAPAGGSKILTKDGQSFDASDLTPEEYQQALNDGYVAQ